MDKCYSTLRSRMYQTSLPMPNNRSPGISNQFYTSFHFKILFIITWCLEVYSSVQWKISNEDKMMLRGMSSKSKTDFELMIMTHEP